MIALGVAFGLHSTRPAMTHFFTKMIPNAFHKGMIAPLVTATVGGVVLGASTVAAIAACKSRRPPTPLFTKNGKAVEFKGSYGKI